jgi:hypothetical protein
MDNAREEGEGLDLGEPHEGCKSVVKDDSLSVVAHAGRPPREHRRRTIDRIADDKVVDSAKAAGLVDTGVIDERGGAGKDGEDGGDQAGDGSVRVLSEGSIVAEEGRLV